jgi:hypothetical protein
MKPSPAALLTVFLFAALPAHASDDLATAISKCAALNDNTARLVCYDKIAGRPTTIVIAPQTEVQAPPPAKNEGESWFGIADWFGSDKASPAVQTTPKQFGSENLPAPPAAPGVPPPAEPLDHITATVSDFAYNPFGRFVVFLDNGQIWQQLEADTDRARFSKTKKDQVTISRGLIGSYNLVIEGHNGLYKVKRIK